MPKQTISFSEITENGETKILAEGGRGGLGNVHFKSSTNQTPRYAQPGEPGIEGWKILELKVLADVGLVGFPSAGNLRCFQWFQQQNPNCGIPLYYAGAQPGNRQLPRPAVVYNGPIFRASLKGHTKEKAWGYAF